jgi:chromosome segregation ATPase
MSDQSNQGVELPDDSGRSLGFVRSEEAVRELTAERDRLRQEVAEIQAKLGALAAERDRLREELAAAQRERDEYLRWLYALTPKDSPITPEEFAEGLKNAVPGEQVFAELEQILKERL